MASVGTLKKIEKQRGGYNGQPLSCITYGVKPSTLVSLGGVLKHARTGNPKTIETPKTFMKKNRGNTMGKALFRTFVANDSLVSQESIKPWWSYGTLPQGAKAQTSRLNSDRDIKGNFSSKEKTILSPNIRESSPSKPLANLDGSLQTIEIPKIRRSGGHSPRTVTDSLSAGTVIMPSTKVVERIHTRRDSERGILFSSHGLSPKVTLKKSTFSEVTLKNIVKQGTFSELAEKNNVRKKMSLYSLTQTILDEIHKMKSNRKVSIDGDAHLDVPDNVSRLQAPPDTSVHEELTNYSLDGNGNVYFMPDHALYRKPKKYNKDTDTLGIWLGNKKLPLPKRCTEECGRKTGRSSKEKSPKKGKSADRKYLNPYTESARFDWSTSYLDKSSQKGAGTKSGKAKGVF